MLEIVVAFKQLMYEWARCLMLWTQWDTLSALIFLFSNSKTLFSAQSRSIDFSVGKHGILANEVRAFSQCNSIVHISLFQF